MVTLVVDNYLVVYTYCIGHTECYKLVDQWQKAARAVVSWLGVRSQFLIPIASFTVLPFPC